MLQVDAHKLHPSNKALALRVPKSSSVSFVKIVPAAYRCEQLFRKAGNDWNAGKAPTFAEGSGDVFGLLETYLGEHRSMRLYDFDDHLENISADWANSKLFD